MPDRSTPPFNQEMEVLRASPFAEVLGPILVCWEPTPVFQVKVRADCANTMGRVHGGFLAALVDITTGQGVRRILADGRSLVTTTTNIEFLATARVGERIDAEVLVEHNTKTLVFASCKLLVDGKPIVRASVVFSARPPVGAPQS